MSSSIEDQLSRLMSGKAIEGDYLPGDGEAPEIPSRELTPLEVKQIASEFRKQVEEGEEDMSLPDDIIADYLHTRDFLYTLLDQCSMAVNGAMGLAKDTDQPRAYQVLRELLETSRELSKDIMALQKTYKEIKKMELSSGPKPGAKGEEGEGNGKTTTSNLLRLLEEMEKKTEKKNKTD